MVTADQRQLDRIEIKLDDFITAHSEQRITMESRITRLETNQATAGWLVTALSALIAAIVGGVASTVGWWRGQ